MSDISRDLAKILAFSNAIASATDKYVLGAIIGEQLNDLFPFMNTAFISIHVTGGGAGPTFLTSIRRLPDSLNFKAGSMRLTTSTTTCTDMSKAHRMSFCSIWKGT